MSKAKKVPKLIEPKKPKYEKLPKKPKAMKGIAVDMWPGALDVQVGIGNICKVDLYDLADHLVEVREWVVAANDVDRRNSKAEQAYSKALNKYQKAQYQQGLTY